MNKIDLTINNRKLTYSFGLGFIGELLDSLDMTLNEVVSSLNKNPFKYVPFLMFKSAEYTLLRKGEEVVFTEFNIMDDIDSDGGLDGKNVVKFLNSFTNSLAKGVPSSEEVKSDKPEKK